MVLRASFRINKKSWNSTRSFSSVSSLYRKINPLEADSDHITSFIETGHIVSESQRDWVRSEYSRLKSSPLSIVQQLNALTMIQMEESFDEFLSKKFSTFKRYSCEGTESIHALLYTLMEQYSEQDKKKSMVLTLTHRGKLSIMASVLRVPLSILFGKIQGLSLIPSELNQDFYYFIDDLVQNIAFSTSRPEFPGLALCVPHTSCHLEMGGSIGMGKTRAKIDHGDQAMQVWVHGDAAVSGQGIVYETTQLSRLPHYTSGGTIHIIENNQIGFTSNEQSERSSQYCTDIFKITGSPILHVNSKAVDDVIRAAILAVSYKQAFKSDFVIDLLGYRKYGHNEVDDPTITNPLMYQSIKKQRETADEYADYLVSQKATTRDHVQNLKSLFENLLKQELENSKSSEIQEEIKKFFFHNNFREKWSGFTPIHHNTKSKTGLNLDKLTEIAKISIKVPENFKIHNVVKKSFQERLKNLDNSKVDWALSETLAFGSLLKEGFNVRLTGEDVVRGTFSQRNIGVYCQETEKAFFPLAQLGPGKLLASSSILSELGVLGFEFGYSLESPRNLVVWESQYGDFSNASQALVDTCIVNCESKTGRQSGIVVLLPHGQEGMGPEHSSALVERYLSLANDPESSQVNIEVAVITFPSNYFHILRRSVMRNFRRPLFIATPKSGLRHKLALSPFEDFNENSSFKPVIKFEKGEGSETLFLCSGRIFLDLYGKFENITLAVVEQLCPIPTQELIDCIKSTGKPIVWVQEEPENFGIWRYIEKYLKQIDNGVTSICRPKMSASAPGNYQDFKDQQEIIIEKVKSTGKIFR